jgi:predicted permease
MTLGEIWRRLRFLFQRDRFERELEEEIQLHIQLRAEELSEPNLHAARRKFGNRQLAMDSSRDEWSFQWLESLLQDIAYAARGFLRTPAFAGMVIGTIGVALGLNTTLFTIFNAYVLRPLQVRDPYSLYRVTWTRKSGRYSFNSFTRQQVEDLRRRNTVFSEVFAVGYTVARIEGQFLLGEEASGNYFSGLGVEAALGRTLVPDDTSALVISHTAWIEKFGSDPSLVGKTVSVHGRSYEIVGIARQGFAGLGEVQRDFWIPLTRFETPLDPSRLQVFGRLKPGVMPQQAKSALSVWAQRETADLPEKLRAIGAILQSNATTVRLTPEVLVAFSPIIAAFVLVLLIACANVANMMLARAISRQREIGIRLSLGAGRSRLVRQLLTESVLLALPAAAAGFVIAQATIHYGQVIMFATMPLEFTKFIRILPLTPDARVFLFILAAAAVATLAFGLAPALQATRLDLMYVARGDFSAEYRPGRLRSGLVVSQVTVCVVLLICAGVLLRGGHRVEESDVGLDIRNVIDVRVGNPHQLQAVQRLSAQPWVESLAVTSRTPLYGPLRTISINGVPGARGGYNFVSPEYFSIFRIPIQRGRNFTQEEANAEAAVAIVSGATARRFWPNQDAIGQSIRITQEPVTEPYAKVPKFRDARVIGIARDVISGFIGDGKDDTCVYFPTGLRGAGNDSLLIRVKSDASMARRALETILTGIAPDALQQANPMEQVLAVQFWPFRVAFWISGVLAGLALALTVSGIYGVMSYLVGQRTKEVGIRMALGATTGAVIQIVLSQAMKLSLCGVGIGVALALGVSRIFASQLVMINTFDDLAYIAGVILVMMSAVAASYFPCRRAARVDPASTLRCD